MTDEELIVDGMGNLVDRVSDTVIFSFTHSIVIASLGAILAMIIIFGTLDRFFKRKA